ncbi:hypothetical protein [Paracraurococcus ruber]|nr:hypothetical protein [Paracraurococcus ruber]
MPDVLASARRLALVRAERKGCRVSVSALVNELVRDEAAKALPENSR